MKAGDKYVSIKPDDNGFVNYPPEDDKVWEILYARQMPIVKPRACQEYLQGLDILDFPEDKVAQIPQVNEKLRNASGWEVTPVAALIGFDKFFKLHADKKFPCATFIREKAELDYLQEPDIFHELFGHCPMITNQVYANFLQAYGKIGINASNAEQVMLARLYWFTVEFGLINTTDGLKIYGGGILSSIGETQYALESTEPDRRVFDPLEILRTPYRIDIMQPIYYVIDDYQQLYDLVNSDLIKLVRKALELGLREPTYPPK